MRLDTYQAGAFFVRHLQRFAHIVHDGGDIILAEMRTGGAISIHLIERPLPLYELKNILADNSVADIHTLFLIFRPGMLPDGGHWYEPDDWMAALLNLYGGKIFAYEVYGAGESRVFPVYFDGTGPVRYIRDGVTINMAELRLDSVHTWGQYLQGAWRVADFKVQQTHGPGQTHKHEHAYSNTHAYASSGRAPMQVYYDILGVKDGDSREVIKQAYRQLARQYHPDLNSSPTATDRMQLINHAYDQILKLIDG